MLSVLLLKIPDGNQSLYIFFSLIASGCLFILFYTLIGKILKDRSHLLKMLFFIICITLPFLHFYFAQYWPHNHEYMAWRNRMVIYVSHFYQWDFLPYWSAGDGAGLGGPLPIYYHKLFYWVSSFLYVLHPVIKDAATLAMIIFAGIGVIGMQKCLKAIGMESWPSLFLAATLPLQYYTLTDWFIRGALAEYTALMIAPWLIWWCLNLLSTGKFSISIGIILAFTYFSHNIIAYYGVFAIIISFVIHISRTRPGIKELSPILKKIVTSLLIFLGFILPYLIPMFLIRKYYDPSKITWDMGWTFKPTISYFWDRDYTWHHFDGYSVQFSPMLTVSILVFIGLIISSMFRNKPELSDTSNPNRKYAGLFIVILFVLFALLQLNFTIPFYNKFPGALFIQFPWRLLTYLQVLLLLILGLLILKYFTKQNLIIVPWITGFFFLGTLASYPLIKNPPVTYQWFPKEEVESFTNTGTFGMGEYMPNVDEMPGGAWLYFNALGARGVEIISAGPNKFEKLPLENPENLVQEYKISVPGDAEVILPINYSGLEKVYLVKNDGSGSKEIKAEYYRTSDDPRIKIKLQSGEHFIRVKLPSIFNFFN